MRGGQPDARRPPGFERLLPTICAEAPRLTTDEAGEAVVRHRRAEIVAHRPGVLEELVGDDAAHDVQPGIVAVVLAAAGAVVAGEGVEGARFELTAEHVDLGHVAGQRRRCAQLSGGNGANEMRARWLRAPVRSAMSANSGSRRRVPSWARPSDRSAPTY